MLGVQRARGRSCGRLAACWRCSRPGRRVAAFQVEQHRIHGMRGQPHLRTTGQRITPVSHVGADPGWLPGCGQPALMHNTVSCTAQAAQ